METKEPFQAGITTDCSFVILYMFQRNEHCQESVLPVCNPHVLIGKAYVEEHYELSQKLATQGIREKSWNTMKENQRGVIKD